MIVFSSFTASDSIEVILIVDYIIVLYERVYYVV